MGQASNKSMEDIRKKVHSCCTDARKRPRRFALDSACLKANVTFRSFQSIDATQA
jgi:hypothetical protein